MPRREDVSQFLDKPDPISVPLITTGYTVDGVEIGQSDSKCHCLYEVRKNGLPRYWIKINSSRRVFDPWSSNDVDAPIFGKLKWDFYQVSLTCFQNYLKFLKTHNHLYLRQAQRELPPA